MLLTEQQQDGLSEVINIAFGKTAASLSDLSGQRVLLEVPKVWVRPATELVQSLESFLTGDLVTVHQVFGGPVAGDALLVMDYGGAISLALLLSDEAVPQPRLDTSAREVLTEVGNILLNACLSVVGDLLQVHISFTVPRLQMDTLDALLDSLVSGKEGLQYALIVSTGFHLRDSAISGFLVIVLGVSSLDRLIRTIDELIK
jgi:chemotaxis protein CheC